MTAEMINVLLPEDSISSAAFGLMGRDWQSVSRSAIIRAALVLFHSDDRHAAREYAKTKHALGTDGPQKIAARVPSELLENIEDRQVSYAVRVGIGMASGQTRKQAEVWARQSVGNIGGRRKEMAT
jgi:hypothetical protein